MSHHRLKTFYVPSFHYIFTTECVTRYMAQRYKPSQFALTHKCCALKFWKNILFDWNTE